MSLYIVATPIGNMDDISLRAIDILKQADLIAAEDTRHSARLMNHLGVETRMIAYHDHNETHIGSRLIESLQKGQSIALISDAGTPLISDPGYRLVRAAQQAGIKVVPIPGPSALIAALCVSGLPTDRFSFEGFLPAKQKARLDRLELVKNATATLVFYEAPHRIQAVIEDMGKVFGEQRIACIARELTKTFEQIAFGALSELGDQLKDKTIVIKGEFVVMIEGQREVVSTYDHEKLMSVLSRELAPKKAAAIASELTGENKKVLYNIALALKARDEPSDDL